MNRIQNTLQTVRDIAWALLPAYFTATRQNDRLQLQHTQHRDLQRESDLQTAQLELEKLRRQTQQDSERIQTLGEKLRDAQHGMERQKGELEQLGRNYETATGQLEETRALLQRRTLELQAAQTFLTKADSVSGADVIQLVHDLNSEIHQAAALLSDLFSFERLADQDAHRNEPSEGQVERLLGRPMVHFLTSRDHSEDPTLVQIALQGTMAQISTAIIVKWSFQPEEDIFVGELYEGIRKTVVQAVAGRWRALTYSQLRRTRSGDGRLTQGCMSWIADFLVGVALAAGCEDEPSRIRQSIIHHGAGSLRTIVETSLHLAQVIKEDITSTDFAVVLVPSASKFIPEIMEDTYGLGEGETEPDVQTSGVVLCTTDIGMQQTTAEVDGNGRTRMRDVILLKPKVVLESVVDIL